MADYLWHRLPLILLFAGGYLVFRLMAATRLTDAFVNWSLRRSHGRASVLLLYIIGAATALSSFIPNAITVLTLLPILRRLDNGFARQGVPGMTTVLMLAAIYGAQLGGMGSMIGSPANAILIGALDFFQVPGRDLINFFNWFLWSVPLVAMLAFIAWGVACLGLPAEARGRSVSLPGLDREPVTRRQRYGAALFWFYMGFWILEAVLRAVLPGFADVSPLACLGFSGLFLYLVFLRPAPASPYGQGPLLAPSDMLRGVPRRGLIFILALAVIFAAVKLLHLDARAAELAATLLQNTMPGPVLFLLVVLAVIFLTEALSNTAVVAAFFTIGFYAAQAHGMDPLPVMIGVSIASTCAFMTPIATPANALAFGEMQGASLRTMLGLGFLLNLACAVVITFWLGMMLPLIY